MEIEEPGRSAIGDETPQEPHREHETPPRGDAPAKKKKPVPVAHVASHFNIFRNAHDAHEGPVTVEEQIKAMERFVRWHERQVQVGQQLLGKLMRKQGAE